MKDDVKGLVYGLLSLLLFLLMTWALCLTCSGCTLTVRPDGSREWRLDGVQTVRAIQKIHATK